MLFVNSAREERRGPGSYVKYCRPCTGLAGYDGPTGLGTPNGVGGL